MALADAIRIPRTVVCTLCQRELLAGTITIYEVGDEATHVRARAAHVIAVAVRAAAVVDAVWSELSGGQESHQWA